MAEQVPIPIYLTDASEEIESSRNWQTIRDELLLAQTADWNQEPDNLNSVLQFATAAVAARTASMPEEVLQNMANSNLDTEAAVETLHRVHSFEIAESVILQSELHGTGVKNGKNGRSQITEDASAIRRESRRRVINARQLPDAVAVSEQISAYRENGVPFDVPINRFNRFTESVSYLEHRIAISILKRTPYSEMIPQQVSQLIEQYYTEGLFINEAERNGYLGAIQSPIPSVRKMSLVLQGQPVYSSIAVLRDSDPGVRATLEFLTNTNLKTLEAERQELAAEHFANHPKDELVRFNVSATMPPETPVGKRFVSDMLFYIYERKTFREGPLVIQHGWKLIEVR